MAKLLRTRLDAAGFDGTRIWLWDHNYDGYRRVLDQLRDAELLKAVDAVAWHPYCGEPSMVDRVRASHPALPFHQTEFGPNIDPALGRDLAFWGKTIIGALRQGCSSFLNFCLVLDANGYPNTSQGLGCGGRRSRCLREPGRDKGRRLCRAGGESPLAAADPVQG